MPCSTESAWNDNNLATANNTPDLICNLFYLYYVTGSCTTIADGLHLWLTRRWQRPYEKVCGTRQQTPAAETDAGSQNNRRSGRTEQPCTIAGHRAAYGTYPIPSLTQPTASVTAAVRASRVINARESTETTISHKMTSQDHRTFVT